MRFKGTFLILLACGASSLFAQESSFPVKFGLLGGVPVTDMFSANNTSEFNDTLPGPYNVSVPRYEFGISGEFRLPHGLRFELDGIVQRAGFDSSSVSGGTTLYQPTKFLNWDVPGLIKKDVRLGHVRPFVEVGAAWRHISSIDQMTYGAAPSGTISDISSALYNRNSFGGVAGFGITFKRGPFEITPEARYTRWANGTFEATGLRTNLNQGDVLIGLSF